MDINRMKPKHYLLILSLFFCEASYTQNFDSSYPFRDYNRISEIKVTENGSFFYSSQGLVQKNYKNNKWTIDTTKKTTKRIREHLCKVSENYFRSVGFSEDNIGAIQLSVPIDCVVDGKNFVYLLEGQSDESLFYSIADISNKYLHRIERSIPQKITLSGNYIFSSDDVGFSKFEREKNGETKYYFLPHFDDNTTVYDDSLILYLANDGLGIQKYNKHNFSIEYYEVTDFNNKIIPFPLFSNIIQHNNEIVVGSSPPENAGAYIFFFQRNSTEVRKKYIGEIGCPDIIFGVGDNILIGQHSTYCDEAENYTGDGGLYRYNSKTDSIKRYPEIKEDEFIVDIKKVNNDIIIKTGQYVQDTSSTEYHINIIKRSYKHDNLLFILEKVSESVSNIVGYPRNEALTENDKYYHGPRTYSNNFKKLSSEYLKKRAFPKLISRICF